MVGWFRVEGFGVIRIIYLDIEKIIKDLQKRLDCQEKEIKKLKDDSIKIKRKMLDKDLVIE